MQVEAASKACIIDTVLSHRENKSGRYQFLIKWKKAAPTWEPIENLQSIQNLLHKYLKENEIVQHDIWGKSTKNNDLCQKNECLHEKLGTFIDDEETRESRHKPLISKKEKKISDESQFVLKYDQFFSPIEEAPSNRYKSHITQNQSQNPFQKPKQIEWKNIKKALNIQFDSQLQKWIVELQFYGKEETIWIERDILRLINPFALLELYIRIQRKNIQKQSIPCVQVMDEQTLEESVTNNNYLMLSRNRNRKYLPKKNDVQHSIIEID